MYSIYSFFLIYAFRIFLGIYFATKDETFLTAKEEMYENKGEPYRSWYESLEISLLFIHIILLGLFTYTIKGGVFFYPILIMSIQVGLFWVYNIAFWTAIWKDANRWSTYSILLSDAMASFTVIAIILMGYNLGVGIVSNMLTFTVGARGALFLVELFAAYLPAIQDTFGSMKDLGKALLRRH